MKKKNIIGFCLLSLLFCFYPGININGEVASSDSYLGMCAPMIQARGRKLDGEGVTRNTIIKLTNETGINFIRTAFKWGVVQPQKGEWNWEKYDALVESAKKHNTKLLAIVNSPPKWANPINEHLNDWKVFIKALVLRYGYFITDWEIWNEPNGKRYWPQDVPMTVFAEMVKDAGRIIKQNQPNARVVLGGMAGSKRAFNVWEGLFRDGVLDYCDAIAMHPYKFVGIKVIEYTNDLKKIVAKYTKRKLNYWITEFGLPFINKTTYSFTEEEYEQQSQTILKTALCFWVVGGEQFFIFSLKDNEPRERDRDGVRVWWSDTDEKMTGEDVMRGKSRQGRSGRTKRNSRRGDAPRQARSKPRNIYYGILKYDLTKKPAFYAVKWLSEIFENYDFSKHEIASDKSVLIELIDSNRDKAYITWGRGSQRLLEKYVKLESRVKPEGYSLVFDPIEKVSDFDFADYADDVLLWQITD